uniref:Uncharacterized protein n=1 Tax=Escherichia coli TaxID=562 RepID=G1CCX4_ECOLX|nr:hypothetical protein [Escherichia coli]
MRPTLVCFTKSKIGLKTFSTSSPGLTRFGTKIIFLLSTPALLNVCAVFILSLMALSSGVTGMKYISNSFAPPSKRDIAIKNGSTFDAPISIIAASSKTTSSIRREKSSPLKLVTFSIPKSDADWLMVSTAKNFASFRRGARR